MAEPYLNPLNSLCLFNLDKYLEKFINLYKQKKLPKVLMVSGKKGEGKFSLIFHLLNFIFDEKYDLSNKKINKDSFFYKSVINAINPNVYFYGLSEENVKIEDIRNLKNILSKSTINQKPRFIILNEIENFNINSLNALLKSIEEPSLNTHFILINNNKIILETIKSRSIEFKINLNTKEKQIIIEKLINKLEITKLLHFENYDLSPGLFLNLNYLCSKENFNIENLKIENLNKILTNYKKTKNIHYIHLLNFIVEIFVKKKLSNRRYNIEDIYSNKLTTLKEIYEFKNFNFNHLNLVNNFKERYINE